MSYYISTIVQNKSFDEAIELVAEKLKDEGFGVLTEIDVQGTLKKKIGADFKKYRILGACNPHFAHKALQTEDKLGLLLPCNVVVEEHENGEIEVSAVDPIVSMSAVNNEGLASLATEVKEKLSSVIDRLKV